MAIARNARTREVGSVNVNVDGGLSVSSPDLAAPQNWNFPALAANAVFVSPVVDRGSDVAAAHVAIAQLVPAVFGDTIFNSTVATIEHSPDNVTWVSCPTAVQGQGGDNNFSVTTANKNVACKALVLFRYWRVRIAAPTTTNGVPAGRVYAWLTRTPSV